MSWIYYWLWQTSGYLNHNFYILVPSLKAHTFSLPIWLLYPQVFIKRITWNGFQPKMYPFISFSGIYWKLFILRMNRTNSRYRAHMNFLTRLFCFYIILNTCLSTIRIVLDTHCFQFFNNIIWLLLFPCFVAKTEIMYILLVYIYFICQNTHCWLQRSHHSCVYINITIWRH